MSLPHAIEAIGQLENEYGQQDQRGPAVLVERAFEHMRRWLAGDVSEDNAARGLTALAAAFERCVVADNFDLGMSPGAAEQVERLAEQLEILGWRRSQLPGLMAALRAGERIKFLRFGAVQVAQPDGRVRVIYTNEITG